jgi:hypothetical protein
LSNWHRLLDRTLQGLSEFERKGQPVPEWVLGGGTALMILADHRLSRDIDAFIDDPQYLALLSGDNRRLELLCLGSGSALFEAEVCRG